ncbi:barstar family protein [Actinokineospora inagensis]|uniref:barstar family protein n=1 Tax=Actinokineospora inagensis TaxID=103730 RepID=UPI000414B6EA|nr:barstar family protein [Actinokineospora inagensis]
MTDYTIDGAPLRTKAAVLTAFADALSFPDWFGHNLDALHDCLTDLGWLPAGEIHVVWTHSAALATADPAAHTAIRQSCADAVTAFATPDRTLTIDIR